MATKKKGSTRTKSAQNKTKADPRKSRSRTRQRLDNKKPSGFSLQDETLEEALISGEYRDLLEDYFGEDCYQELRALAAQSRRARLRGGPRVLILPGIMGSKLGRSGIIFDDTIWVDPLEIIAGNLTELELKNSGNDVESLGVMLLSYLRIKLKLRAAGFDADFHHYDWRQDIERLGGQLAERIRKEAHKGNTTMPLYLVAHSMGGLVSRAALHKLDASEDSECVSRLVMLGTPNYGSFSPVQALSGYHSLIRKVAALDLRNDEKKLVNQVFSTFTGLYQMLPAPGHFSDMDLYNLDNWPPTGMAPRKELLHQALGIQDKLAPGDNRFLLIAGINQETVIGVHRAGDGFVFTKSLEGDGTVPLGFAQLEDIKTYFVEESHGSLPNNGDVGRAVIELLETGHTDVLPQSWTPKRGGVTWDVRGEDLAPEPFDGRTGEQINRRELRNLLQEFAAPAGVSRDTAPTMPVSGGSGVSEEPIVVGRKRQGRVSFNLACGDVTQVDARAVVLGLFKEVTPAGPARAIDEHLDGAISDFMERRLLSANAGQVFIMPANRYRIGAEMVVFAGLGTYDEFSEETLRLVGENVARALTRTKVYDFTTVMLGLGSGLAMQEVLENLITGFIRGVADSNSSRRSRSRPHSVTFCERDQQRFAQMHQEILRLSNSPLFDDVEVTVDAFELPPAPILPTRCASTGPAPVYLMVREVPGRDDATTEPSVTAPFVLRASVLTVGSKATVVTDSIEVDARKLNRHLETIETRQFDYASLESFGNQLAELVLPKLVRHAMAQLHEYPLVVINDARSSRIPWETISIERRFPAAGAGLSRKYEAENMTVAKWLEKRRLDEHLNVLLIVDPTKDLPGAYQEGERIKQILEREPNVRLDEMWQAEASFSAIRAAFRSGKYDVVHYAGHAFFDPINRSRSGILCHGGRVLSGADMAGLERLPALMFFNACEAGRIRGVRRARTRADRDNGDGTAARLEKNQGFAEALLRAGVGNYVGTYWPVGDAAAKEFGEVFYRKILSGASLGKAIGDGRHAVKTIESVDWADYILYGSPEFVVKRRD